MIKIEQGIFLDFNYKCSDDDSFKSGFRVFRTLAIKVPELLDSRRLHTFKSGYEQEPFNSKPLHRILLLDGVLPSIDNFKIYQAVDYLTKVLYKESDLECALLSAQYKEINEANAKALLGKKDYLVITELLGFDRSNNIFKLGKIYALSNIFNYLERI